MSMNMPPAVYWYKNQIAVTFHSDVQSSDIQNTSVINTKREKHLQDLNLLLKNPDGTSFTLIPLENTMPSQQVSIHTGTGGAPAASGDLDGICLYPAPFQTPPPIGVFEPKYDLVDFYTIKTIPMPTPPISPTPPMQGGTGESGGMGGMSGMSGMTSMDGMGGTEGTGGMGSDTSDVTIQVLKQLYAKRDSISTPLDATPHWFYAGTDDVTHGCPITPPFPAAGYSNSGQWKFMSPLVGNMQSSNNTGAGVTVFVLDAFPTAEQITTAATRTGCDNPLLQGMAKGMVSIPPTSTSVEARAIPPAITLNRMTDSNEPQGVTTGKDLYGNLVGFSLIDHGLTIAGIIRDLAPEANIECIRVLNDHGVGFLNTLINALTSISSRMQQGGDLYNKPVVINLSLVIGPPVGDFVRLGLDDDLVKQTLSGGLLRIIQTLAGMGAILVASAGNDSDPRDPMHAPGTRLGPRYPAAFAYNLDPATAAAIIPVGAINGHGEVTSYSNYPGPDGIAAYGGEIPTPYPPKADASMVTQIDPMVELDAVRGVYSSATFPALSMTDTYPPSSSQAGSYPEYAAPDASAWTCWVGTSFATPVISGLAACLLQGQKPNTIHVRQALKDAPATQSVMWTGLSSGEMVAGPAIMVMQEFKLNQGNMPVH